MSIVALARGQYRPQLQMSDNEMIKKYYRVTLAEVGRELTSFNSTKEFLEVMTHAIEGKRSTSNYSNSYLMYNCI